MKLAAIIMAVIIFILLGILIFVQPAKGPAAPVSPSPSSAAQPAVSSDGHLKITFPLPHDLISDPVAITGTVTGGGWFFEGSFPIKILDGHGVIVGNGIAQAQGDWMSTGTVPFAATIRFGASCFGPTTILFAKDNPSGLPQNVGELRVPIVFPSLPCG